VNGIAMSSVKHSGKMVSYKSDGDNIDAYLVIPEGAKGRLPTMIVVQEIWGLTDHLKDVTDRFAREGYLCLTPDLYSREGGPLQPPTMEVLRPWAHQIPDARIVADLRCAVDYLEKLEIVDPKRIGVVGFCNGGTHARMLAAEDPRIAACADFYGRTHWLAITKPKPHHPIDLLVNLKCPYLGLFAGEDKSIPVENVHELDRRLANNLQHEVHIFPGAPHAFFNDTRPSYRPDVAKEAWAKVTKFLGQYLGQTGGTR
jgi:carboxymethylenebutenolidase